MFRLEVRDHVMIAHSFRGDVFGPAQRLHGATYVVDLELAGPELDEDGVLADIGALSQVLAQTLEPLRYRNLDELPEFDGVNTTTEYVARWIQQRIVSAVRRGALGDGLSARLRTVKVTLHESHVARASYESALGG